MTAQLDLSQQQPVADIRSFLDVILGHRQGFLAIAIGRNPYRDDRDKYQHRNWYEKCYPWPTRSEHVLKGVKQVTGGDVYFCPALRHSANRKKDSASPPTVCWADLDGPAKDPALLAALQPVIVDSGSMAHQHIYVPLTREIDLITHERINKRLAELLGGDAKWADNSLLRLPGTWNYKQTVPVNGQQPLWPTSVSIASESYRRWDPVELMMTLRLSYDGTVTTPTGPTPPAVGRESVDTVMLPQSIKDRLANEEPEDRSAAFQGLVNVCHKAGYTQGQTLTIVRSWRPALEKYDSRLETELARSWGKAESSVDPLFDELQPKSANPPSMRTIECDGLDDPRHDPSAHMRDDGANCCFQRQPGTGNENEPDVMDDDDADLLMRNHAERKAKKKAESKEYRNLTDLGNAERLIDLSGPDMLHLAGSWFIWDGTRYKRDENGEVIRRAKKTVRNIYGEAARANDPEIRAELVKHARSSESSRAISAMVQLASTEKQVAVDGADSLDQHPMLLNCLNGTVDLKTGQLLTHSRQHRITMRANSAYDAEAVAPTFDAFLARIQPDPEVRMYLQRVVGYTLTGLTVEEKMWMLNGGGANGKSTLIDVIMYMMGEYAQKSAPELLTVKRSDGPSNDIAALRGARLVTTAETEEGAKLHEVRTKELVTGDRQSARFLYKELFQFKPVAKYWIATNHRPIVRGSDNAIWRRVALFPFNAFIPPNERDKGLGHKLRQEIDGILSWAVQGCLAWQRFGLAPPLAIQQATDYYRDEQDLIGAFLVDCCDVNPQNPNLTVDATTLYVEYAQWCKNNGENPQSQRRLAQRLAERGLWKDRPNNHSRVTWHGVGVKTMSPIKLVSDNTPRRNA